MNSSWTTLRDVLEINLSHITVMENVFYKSAVVQPYPRGVVLKAVKSGFDFSKKSHKPVSTGQFIISKVRAHQRIWGIIPPGLDGAVVNLSYLIFDLQSHLNPDYFAAYLSTPLFRQAALAARSKHGRLRVRQFAEIRIPLPPMEQQRQVAALWNEANTALGHTLEMFSSMTDIKSGVGVRLFQSGNASWERKTLGECTEIGDHLSGNDVLYLKLPNHLTLGASLFDEGGVRIAPNLELDSQFLYYYLESQKPMLRANMAGTKSRLEDILRSLPLPLPPLYEQRKIAAIIQQHDEALLWMRAEQAALRHLTELLMNNIFTGTLDLQDAMPILQNLLAERREMHTS